MMKRLLIIILLLAALSGVAFAQTPQETCLLRLTPYVGIVADAGLYPSVYLAQAALETGWCKSSAVNYNNFWGIKCRGDLCFAKDTWEIYDGEYWQGKKLFQVFDSARAGTEAYVRKILWQKEYQGVDYSSRDAYIDSLASVWATDPDYANKLKRIINERGLAAWDAI